jgi:hypothetical protein
MTVHGDVKVKDGLLDGEFVVDGKDLLCVSVLD